ncbi:hypothetical protein TPHA_0G01090 [Tetrapisispora phaffii CBS 4417]|uniref:AMP-dependent synthetase/ligase domain-containing protein n=1 Tax=Tetrapisispora phaffii (strain ATCC 24235 / CBS 4417 / NBRC 1672 / NRRL Y-8282 / UCD 70-5) TaxID=1071381 RepID=G8BVL8_TETPH|nr:hypothetical protein TPHA_0G01090 [Tetrapisispora phaffii CBS 4417]CCE63946.1 hypothetical protein TPHA_0G01090 [Tetrapisispora phaffii CBS 4417]
MAEQCTKIVGKAANEHETAPRVSTTVDTPLVRPKGYSCSTAYEFLLEAFERGGKRTAMGWRDIIEIHEDRKKISKKIDGKVQEIEKTWLYFELTDYKYIKFNELTNIMHDMGRGLVKIGLNPHSEDKLHIYASTSHKWMKTFCGAQSQSIPIVTAYDTLGESGLTHSLIQSESKAIFTDNSLLATLINPLKTANSIKYIIHTEKIDSNDKRQNGKIYQDPFNAVEKIKEIRPDIQFFHYDQIIKLGKDSKGEIEPHPPKPEDLSCIMYTSGSTGDPKGVPITHANLVAGIAGVSETVYGDIGSRDRIIAFLPLAHIFELLFELIVFYWGGVLGYANVKTLTPTSIRNCESDLALFKPSVMVGVAAVFEMIKKGIITKLNEMPKLTQKVFWSAYNTKSFMNNYHIPGGNTVGNLIFKKVRSATGGNLRLIMNGGSPISIDTQKFISNVLCTMLVGYGLTETCANGCVTRINSFEFGIAGSLVGSVTAKLRDVDELGYLAKNNQGEILLKGASVIKEYYKNPQETAEAFTDDGWFCTGDIGEWTSNGQIKIIDRKKNLVKTANGEYIALEKLESIYRSCQYVTNICVYADQHKVKPVGIVVPNLAPLKSEAVKQGILKADEDIEDYLEDKKVNDMVFKTILQTGRAQGLAGIELLQGVVLFKGEWTPQNGYVTSAQKLKRKAILDNVKSQVDKIYA